jgi:hypothetical protein
VTAVLFHVGCIGTAAAQHLDLTWQAPPECPNTQEIERRILDLPQDPYLLDGLGISATISKSDAGHFALMLVIQRAADLPATRNLSASQCDALTDAALWLIELALNSPNSAGTVQAPPAEPTGGADEDKPPVLRHSAGEEAMRAPQARSAWSYSIRAGVLTGILWQGLAGPQALAGVRAGVVLQGSYTELRIQHAFARSLRLPGGASAMFDGQTLALVQCLEFVPAPVVRLLPCLGADLDRTHGRTQGLDATRDRASYWFAGSGRAQAFVRLGSRLELGVDVAVRLPVTDRPRFVVDGVGTISEVRFVSIAIALGLSAHF